MNATLDNSTIVTAAGALFLPLVIAWLRGRDAPSRFAALLAFAAIFAWTLLAWFLTDTLDWGHAAPTLAAQVKTLLVNLLLAALTAWGTFRNLWEPLGATGALERSGPQLGGSPPN